MFTVEFIFTLSIELFMAVHVTFWQVLADDDRAAPHYDEPMECATGGADMNAQPCTDVTTDGASPAQASIQSDQPSSDSKNENASAQRQSTDNIADTPEKETPQVTDKVHNEEPMEQSSPRKDINAQNQAVGNENVNLKDEITDL